MSLFACHVEQSRDISTKLKTQEIMQQQLHTILCHPERSEGSHFQIYKYSNFKILLFSILYSLFSIPGYAQNYDWDWAVSGGGPLGATYLSDGVQQIHDIKVGTDNNYYFVASINGTFGNDPNGALLDGQPVKQYNAHLDSYKDIFLFSTTCDGQVRWSQAIGGYMDDWAYNLALDSNNNVYIGAMFNVGLHTYSNPRNFYTYFSPTDSINFPNSIRVTNESYLIKYDSNGQYQGKKALSDTHQNSYAGGGPAIYDLFIDSNDTIHFIAALYYGTYLGGAITVPSQYVYTPHPHYTYHTQYHLIKCDTNLNYISNMVLPVDPNTGITYVTNTTRFTYDENLNRYYIASMRSLDITGVLLPFTYEGKPFIERSYVLAINGTDGSEAWRREIYTPSGFSGKNQDRFTSIIVDPVTSDVYVGGQIWKSINAQNLKIYDPHNPTTTTYTFTPVPYTNLPMLIKFNSSGTVQWLKTPTAFAPNYSSNTQFPTKGLALRHNEVAFGSSDQYFVWDGFSQNNPDYYQPKPHLLRFNKNTGQTIGSHDIKGFEYVPSGMTAVAVDNDGNYVVGGTFKGGLFTDGGKVPVLSPVGSKYSFFVAKLAASVCGTAVSTEEFNQLNVKVYPNPTSDIVNIETHETLQNYEVYNVLGQQIQNGMFNGTNQINLHGATAGVYFIKVTTVQGSSATVKVVKQ